MRVTKNIKALFELGSFRKYYLKIVQLESVCFMLNGFLLATIIATIYLLYARMRYNFLHSPIHRQLCSFLCCSNNPPHYFQIEYFLRLKSSLVFLQNILKKVQFQGDFPH